MSMWPPAFDEYVEPARKRPQIWRLLLGLLLCLVIYMIGLGGVFALLAVFDDVGARIIGTLQSGEGAGPETTLVLLFSFLAMGLGPIIAAPLIQKRSARTLFGARSTMVRHFAVAAVTLALVGVIGVTIVLLGGDVAPNTPLGLWLTLLPLALLAILIQTGAEEILFRGYMQQQLAARFRSRWVFLGVPTVLFGLAHFDPTSAGSTAPLIVLATGLFGFLAADLTYRTGNIGAAWGFHFANNTIAMLIVAVSGPLSGLSLFETTFEMSDVATVFPLLLVDMAATVTVYFIIRRVLRA